MKDGDWFDEEAPSENTEGEEVDETLAAIAAAIAERLRRTVAKPLQAETALREIELVCANMIAWPNGIAERSKWGPQTRDVLIPILKYGAGELSRARIYVWDLDYYAAATRGSESMTGALIGDDDLPLEPEYWTFNLDVGLTNYAELGLTPHHMSVGIFVIPTRVLRTWLLQGIPTEQRERAAKRASINMPDGSFYLFSVYQLSDTAIASGALTKVGDLTPIMRLNGPIKLGPAPEGLACQYLAARRWSRLPFVDASAVVLPRASQRRRQKAKLPPADVRVIRLRPKEHEGGSEEGGHVAFTCHFLVGGHWRKPPAHMRVPRPIYVSPYVKGDRAKPFKPPTRAVALVNR